MALTTSSEAINGKLVAVTRLPTQWGEFSLHGFQFGDEYHLALSFGNMAEEGLPLVRIHSECLTGDALFSQRCDCGAQLKSAMEVITNEGRGIVLYLSQEGRGIGLLNKLRAYALQDCGLDTVDANIALQLSVDARKYDMCKFMLDYFGVNHLRLITNNPLKQKALEGMGFIVERLPTIFKPNSFNTSYLATKAARLGHLINIDETNENDNYL